MENGSIGKLEVKIDRLYDALMGDKLDRKVGYFDQIEANTLNLKNQTKEIEKIRIKVDDIETTKVKDITPWGKIVIAACSGFGAGGFGAAKGSDVITKIMELFT
tara:strand:- start:120 stop:431 length:312 start_codon:yes stop_codon:yes gene_type:complete